MACSVKCGLIWPATQIWALGPGPTAATAPALSCDLNPIPLCLTLCAAVTASSTTLALPQPQKPCTTASLTAQARYSQGFSRACLSGHPFPLPTHTPGLRLLPTQIPVLPAPPSPPSTGTGGLGQTVPVTGAAEFWGVVPLAEGVLLGLEHGPMLCPESTVTISLEKAKGAISNLYAFHHKFPPGPSQSFIPQP